MKKDNIKQTVQEPKKVTSKATEKSAKILSPPIKLDVGGKKNLTLLKSRGSNTQKTLVHPVMPGTVEIPRRNTAIPNGVEQTLQIAEQVSLNNAGNQTASLVYFNNPFEPSSGSAEAPGNAFWGNGFTYGIVQDIEAEFKVANREVFAVTAYGFFGPANAALTTGNTPLSAMSRNVNGRSVELSAVGGMDKGTLRFPRTSVSMVADSPMSNFSLGGTYTVNSNVPPVAPNLISFWIGIDSNGAVLVSGVFLTITIRYRVLFFSRITSIATFRDPFGRKVEVTQDDLELNIKDRLGIKRKPDPTLALLGFGKTRYNLDPGEFAVQMPDSFIRRFHFNDEDAFYDSQFTFVRDMAPFAYVVWREDVRSIVLDQELARYDLLMKNEPFFGFCGMTWQEVVLLKERRELENRRIAFKIGILKDPSDVLTNDSSEIKQLTLVAQTFLDSVVVSGKSIKKTS